jgi:polysaccharide biosynthesis transport protein
LDTLYEQFRVALHQLWQRRWLALAVAWGVAVAGWLAVALIPNNFEAKGRLFVALDTLPGVAMDPAARQNDLLRLKQTLVSDENLTRVVRRTDLNSLVTSDAQLGAIVAALRTRIQVVAQPDNIVEITARSNVAGFSNAQNARASAAVVQQLIELFTSGEVAGDTQQTNAQLAAIDEQLRRREGELQEAEQRRVEFEQRYMGTLPGSGTIENRLAGARTELAQLEQTIVAAQASLNAMRGQLAATPATIPIEGAGSFGGPASAQLAALEVQLSQYVGRGFTDQHPDIISLRSQIARLRPQAASERSNAGSGGISNPSHVSLRAMIIEREAQLAGAQTRRNQLQADLTQLGTRQESEPGAAAEQQRLSRDYEVRRLQYERLLADREQLRLRGDLQSRTAGMTVRVVEPPRVPTAPASPNRPLFLTLVLIVAIGAGVGVAFVKGQLQTTFPSQNRLAAATGLPVFGAIGEVVDHAERARRRQRLVWLGGGAAALLAGYGMMMAIEFFAIGSA